ncbi:hypothetical protein [Streptomyces sp. NPDC088739]|uniref:hypothetical protein n=1 Tax=Streptomyces sp. NPDC088739 TaxID=3365882 RepID=UPI00382EC246
MTLTSVQAANVACRICGAGTMFILPGDPTDHITAAALDHVRQHHPQADPEASIWIRHGLCSATRQVADSARTWLAEYNAVAAPRILLPSG